MSRDVTTVKVVVTGPAGSGKTSFVSAISEIPVLSSPTAAAGDGAVGPAIDFGKVTVGDERSLIELFLFGTAGQSPFMWEVLSQGMLGFVVVVDGSDEGSWADTREILEWFRRPPAVPFVVGLNRVAPGDDAVRRLREELELAPAVAVLACDASERTSARAVLLALLAEVLDDLEPRITLV